MSKKQPVRKTLPPPTSLPPWGMVLVGLMVAGLYGLMVALAWDHPHIAPLLASLLTTTVTLVNGLWQWRK